MLLISAICQCNIPSHTPDHIVYIENTKWEFSPYINLDVKETCTLLLFFYFYTLISVNLGVNLQCRVWFGWFNHWSLICNQLLFSQSTNFNGELCNQLLQLIAIIFVQYKTRYYL